MLFILYRHTSASLSMPIQHVMHIIIIHVTPKNLNAKLSLIMPTSYVCNRDLNDKQNPIVFIATEIVFANANRIPMDAPNSGPMDLEIMK